MTGGDGAQFLQNVCDYYPAVVRIVLSSQKDLPDALRTIPIAHQFLIKPCDPSMLRVGIERATSLSQVLNNKLLVSLVGSVRDLPVIPRTYMALRKKLSDPAAPLNDVVRLVAQDVAISAKILQLANSSFFGLPQEITTLETAVKFLGLDMLQNVVLSAEVFRAFENAPPLPGFSLEEIRMHSQFVAKIAAGIPASSPVRSAAVVAGLLHDVGKLVLAVRSPKHWTRVIAGALEEKRPFYEVEEELMGISHAEVGAYLLSIWGLPCTITEAVAHHHRPGRVPQDSLDAVAIVHIANALAHGHSARARAEHGQVFQLLDPEYLKSLGVFEEMDYWESLAENASMQLREGLETRL
jgi:HD-like signal output (HDOD) protein